jgi:outer membrane receptor protein involved in Fe transport
MLFLTTLALGQSNPNSRRLTSSDLSWLPAAVKTTISVSFRDAPLEEALHIIAVKGDLRLSYNRDQLPKGQNVTLQLNEVPALEALLQVAALTSTEVLLTNGEHLAIIPAIPRPGIIRGVVLDGANGRLLRGVNVLLAGTYRGAASDQLGRFMVREVQPGRHTVQFTMMGYTPEIREIQYDGYTGIDLTVELEPTVLSLGEVVIASGHFSLMEDIPTTRHALRAEDIRSFPQLGEDIYRAVSRLPGVTSNDIAAGFYVRGGDHEQVLVLLDGMELYNPFHLKALDGFMSMIDVESIRGIDMITGAYPAEYGNRLSGVFNLKTISPLPYRKRTSLAISFLNARLLAENSFAKGRGQWLFLARRGYIDLLLKGAGEDIGAPFYYDILSKIHFNLSPRHSLSGHILIAHDSWTLPVDDDISLDTRNLNGYGWLTWYSQWGSNLKTRTLFSRGSVEDLLSLEGIEADGSDVGDYFIDQQYLHLYGLKQDWSWDISDKYLLKWGFDVKDFDSHINYYHRLEVILGQIDTYFTEGFDLASAYGSNDGVEFSSYLTQRMRPIEPMAIELGLRYEGNTWSHDSHWSPRINLVYNLSDRTSIRAGWGHYYQAQSITSELAKYGNPEYYPAERAEHRVMGIEHELPNGTMLRVEGYQKVLTSLRPHYIDWGRVVTRILPSISSNRIRLEPDNGDAVGIELYVFSEDNGPLSYWLSYSLSRTREKVNGQWIPRYYDQRHTFYCDLSWKPNHKWRLNLAWQYHTGWPYTAAQIVDLHQTSQGIWEWRWGPGPLYVEKFPDYNRADFRMNRSFFTKRGRITVFLELRNILDRKNPREYRYAAILRAENMEADPEIEVILDESLGWMSRVPSFGIIWDF